MSALVQVATVLLGVPIVAAAVVLAFRFVRRMHDVHEAIIGRPEGPANDAVPSMIKRFDAVHSHLAQQDNRLADIESYLGDDRSIPFVPNGLKKVQ